jgi:hypothetical protein
MKTNAIRKIQFLFSLVLFLFLFTTSCENDEKIVQEEKREEVFIYQGEKLIVTSIKQETTIIPIENDAYNKVSKVLAKPNSTILIKGNETYLFDTEKECSNYLSSIRRLNKDNTKNMLKQSSSYLEVYFYVNAFYDTEISSISGSFSCIYSPHLIYNLQNLGCNDQISSFKVIPSQIYDYYVKCYQHADFLGHCLIIVAEANSSEEKDDNLADNLMYWKNIFKRVWWNDQISSIKIERQ